MNTAEQSGDEGPSPFSNNWLFKNNEQLTEAFARVYPESDYFLHPEHFVPGRMIDYETWLQGYLMNGGMISGLYSGDWAKDYETELLYATHDFTLDDERGSTAKTIIVMPGIAQEGTIGNNGLFFLEDFTFKGKHEIPVFVTPEIAKLKTLLTPSFWGGFIGELVTQRSSGSVQTDKLDEDEEPRETTEDKYRQFAETLGIAFTDDDIVKAKRQANDIVGSQR